MIMNYSMFIYTSINHHAKACILKVYTSCRKLGLLGASQLTDHEPYQFQLPFGEPCIGNVYTVVVVISAALRGVRQLESSDSPMLKSDLLF